MGHKYRGSVRRTVLPSCPAHVSPSSLTRTLHRTGRGRGRHVGPVPAAGVDYSPFGGRGGSGETPRSLDVLKCRSRRPYLLGPPDHPEPVPVVHRPVLSVGSRLTRRQRLGSGSACRCLGRHDTYVGVGGGGRSRRGTLAVPLGRVSGQGPGTTQGTGDGVLWSSAPGRAAVVSSGKLSQDTTRDVPTCLVPATLVPDPPLGLYLPPPTVLAGSRYDSCLPSPPHPEPVNLHETSSVSPTLPGSRSGSTSRYTRVCRGSGRSPSRLRPPRVLGLSGVDGGRGSVPRTVQTGPRRPLHPFGSDLSPLLLWSSVPGGPVRSDVPCVLGLPWSLLSAPRSSPVHN